MSRAEYKTILRGYRIVFDAAEAQRAVLAIWGRFSLSAHCTALALDAEVEHKPDMALFQSLRCPPAVLGMLYTLHGAQFGGGVIQRNLLQVLPDEAHHYFSMGTQPALWRDLTATLDRDCQTKAAREQVIMGATTVFQTLAETCAPDTTSEND
ncbi:hypothetical protein [uncultured Roseobacter sp.]|uniref:hypothetical protein n=1 Tax=uncultured Roseobacter sp. TaxID=114847 RepID=UPI00262058F8|nr:hypothetical protein [uncultured Roseobacter sp.]